MLNLHEIYAYIFENRANDHEEQIKRTRHFSDEAKQKIQERNTHKIKQLFSSITEKERFSGYLTALQAFSLKRLLYGTDYNISYMSNNAAFSPNETIADYLVNLNKQYGYLSEDVIKDENLTNTFSQLFKTCKIVHTFFEKTIHPRTNNEDNNKFSALNAYKILVLFKSKNANPFHEIDKHLLKFENNSQQPLYDALDFTLPVNLKQTINLQQWQTFITGSAKAAKIFEFADDIKRVLGRDPASFAEAQKIASIVKYKRANEYPELAELCIQYNVTEEIFDRCLKIKADVKAQDDDLPNIHIDGAKVGHAGYHLIKLPFNDPRAFILGEIVHCCQSIGGDSERCVIDGLTRKNNGFYVLLKRKDKSYQGSPFLPDGTIDYQHYEIVGEAYGWLSENNNLVLDSWENLRSSDDVIARDMLQAMGQSITGHHTTVMRLLLGIGGGTSNIFSCYPTIQGETMREGFQYRDSLNQYVLYTNRVKEIVQQIYKKHFFTRFRGKFIDIFKLNQSIYDELIKTIDVGDNALLPKYKSKLDSIFSDKFDAEWKTFFTEDTCINAFLKSSDKFTLLYALNLLMQVNCFTPENYSKLILMDGLSYLIDNLLQLKDATIARPEFITFLINQKATPPVTARNIIDLHQCGFDTQNILTIVENVNTVNVNEFIEGICVLKRANFYTDKAVGLLKSSKEGYQDIAAGLIKLDQHGIDNDIILSKLIAVEYKIFIDAHANQLIILNEAKLLNKYGDLVLKGFEHLLANEIVIFEQDGLLDDRLYKLLDTYPNHTRTLVKFKSHLKSEEVREKLYQFIERIAKIIYPTDFSKILEELENLQMINEANLKIILSLFEESHNRWTIGDNIVTFIKELNQLQLAGSARDENVALLIKYLDLPTSGLANSIIEFQNKINQHSIFYKDLLSAKNPREYITALINLNENKIGDKENSKILSSTYFCYETNQALLYLHQHGYLNKKNRKYIQHYLDSEKNPHSVMNLSEGLTFLIQNSIDSKQHRRLIKEHALYAIPLSQCLKLLNAEALNSDDNCDLLAKYSAYAPFVTRALIYFKEHKHSKELDRYIPDIVGRILNSSLLEIILKSLVDLADANIYLEDVFHKAINIAEENFAEGAIILNNAGLLEKKIHEIEAARSDAPITAEFICELENGRLKLDSDLKKYIQNSCSYHIIQFKKAILQLNQHELLIPEINKIILNLNPSQNTSLAKVLIYLSKIKFDLSAALPCIKTMVALFQDQFNCNVFELKDLARSKLLDVNTLYLSLLIQNTKPSVDFHDILYFLNRFCILPIDFYPKLTKIINKDNAERIFSSLDKLAHLLRSKNKTNNTRTLNLWLSNLDYSQLITDLFKTLKKQPWWSFDYINVCEQNIDAIKHANSFASIIDLIKNEVSKNNGQLINCRSTSFFKPSADHDYVRVNSAVPTV